MKTKASILREAPGRYETAEVELEGPRPGEIMVKMVAAGLCHSDDHLATADLPVGHYPIAGGHEGAGVVVEVGRDTAGFQVGDHVVFSFIPACGRCRPCAQGKQNLCDLGAAMLQGSRFEDLDSFRMSLDGAAVGQMAGLSTFSEYTTVSVHSAVKVPQHLPLEKLCLLGCGVGTGWGSAVNAADVKPGQTVIVMGIGGIGISAVQGAVHAGAQTLIAVDPIEFKRDSAKQFGATHAVASIEEATELVHSMTNGQGADSTIVTVGVTGPDHVGAAIESVRKAGTVVVTGAGPAAVSDVPINLLMLTMMEKRIQGALYGMSSPFHTIPWLADMYASGQLKLDEMITRTYSLDQVAEGFDHMHAGEIIRGVVLFDQ